jgi:hypothetical protein
MLKIGYIYLIMMPSEDRFIVTLQFCDFPQTFPGRRVIVF